MKKKTMFSLLRLNFTKNSSSNIKNGLHSSPFLLSKELNEKLSSKYKNTPVYTFAQKPRNSNRVGIKDRIFVWGYAGTGALGESSFLKPKFKIDTPKYHQRKPWRLKWADRVDADPIHVACGNGFSLIATSSTQDLKGHHLFGTGMNTESQIGVHEVKKGEKLKYIIEPAIIDLPFDRASDKKLKILDITCGRAHSIVLTNFGLISFGNNSYGQCGRPIIENEEYFGNRAVIQNVSKYLELDSDDEVVSVEAGQDHTCFLTKKGHVLTCGWSADGQLGQGIYTVNALPKKVKGALESVKIVQIATKGDFVLALSNEGEIFGWGNNEYKQLSMCGSIEPQIGTPVHLKLPDYVKRPILKVAASGTNCLIVDNDNNVWVWGFGLMGKGPKYDEFILPSKIPNTLFGMYPEIEHSLRKRPVLVRCGLNSAAIGFDDGSLYMWGKNKYGNLGTGESVDSYIPLRVNIPASIKSIDCGPDQTFAICKTNV